MSSFWGDGSPVVSAPAIIRGTVSLGSSGVISGTGLTSDARIANGAAIQAAINSAAGSKKFFEAPPGDYEFDLGGGLTIDSSGFNWIGARDTNLIQFRSNTPVITIGKQVSNSDGWVRMNIDGFSAAYGVDQTGNTSANAIVMASSWMSSFRNISSGYKSGFSTKPYRSIYFNGSGSGKFWFSNSLSDSIFGHAQQEIWRHSLMSTGCSYNNIYIGGGAPTITAYPTQPVIFSNGGGRGQGSVFNQLNIEWVSGTYILFLDNVKQYTFNSLHLEGCQLTGSFPAFIYLNSAEVSGQGWDLENCKMLSPSASGTPAIFNCNSASKAIINSMRLGWLDTSLNDNNVNMNYRIPWSESSSTVGARLYIRNLYVEGGGSYGTNPLIASGDAPFPSGSNYVYNGTEQYFEDPYYLPAGDFVVYGCYRNPYIRYSAALGADRNLTLSDRRGSAGWQNLSKVQTGATALVYRATGTADHTLTIKNYDGTTLATNTTSDTRYRFVFDGTNWVKVQ